MGVSEQQKGANPKAPVLKLLVDLMSYPSAILQARVLQYRARQENIRSHVEQLSEQIESCGGRNVHNRTWSIFIG